MKKNSTWNDMLKPVVVLTVICLITTTILGVTNNITAPIIAERAQRAADAARIELLPEADSFEAVEFDAEDGRKGLKEVYKAKNGAGYTISAAGKGYGGEVIMMVAFNDDGEVVDLRVLSQSETQGLGTKICDESFIAQFRGTTDSSGVDSISGATISSGAAITGVDLARDAFNKYAKGVVKVELTLEQKLGQLFGEDTPAAVLTTDYSHENAVEFWQTDKGIIIVTEGKGNGIIGDEHTSGLYLKGYVAFDETGAVCGVYYDAEASETPGLGTKICDASYIANFIGMTDSAAAAGVDVIANCTYSSMGARECVAKAIDVYNAVK